MKCPVFTLFLFALAGAAPASAASGPAFDCNKAAHEIEVLICQHEALGARDRKLDEVYRQALAVLATVADADEATSRLKTEQRGWVKGRNDCWKSENKVSCASDAYDRRISELQARYMLVAHGDPVFFTCNGNPSDEIVATFVMSDPPSVRLERGDELKVGILSPSGSGAKYEADFGVTFWTQGDEAQVSWPEGNDFSCVVRK